MILVYKQTGSMLSGYIEYACDFRTRSAPWFERYFKISRAKTANRPTRWKPVDKDTAIRLSKCIDPDNPPDAIEINEQQFIREDVSVLLPNIVSQGMQ